MSEPYPRFDVLFAWLSTYWIHSTLLLGACWFLTSSLLRQRHGINDRLWKTAVIASFFTAAFQVSLHRAFPPSEIDAARSMNDAPQAGESTAQVKPDDPAPRWFVRVFASSTIDSQLEFSAAAVPVNGRGASGPMPSQTTVPPKSVSISSWVCAAALLWSICGALVVALTSVRFGLKLRGYPVAEGEVAREVQSAAIRAGISRSLRVLRTPPDLQPSACGVFVPTVLLPEELENRLSSTQLSAVIAHEIAHLQRHDGIWLWIGRLVVSCFGYQPLNVLARRRWQAASEFLCDQNAVGCGIDPLSLARSLTRLTHLRFQCRSTANVFPATGNRTVVVGRVAKLTSATPYTRPWGIGKRLSFAVAFGLTTSVFLAAAPFVPAHRVIDTQVTAVPVDATTSLGEAKPPTLNDMAETQSGRALELVRLKSELDALRHDMVLLTSLLTSLDPTQQVAANAMNDTFETMLNRYRTLETEILKETNDE